VPAISCQYIAVTIFFAIGAWLFENNVVHWTGEFVLSLIWLAVVLSIGSIGLLYWLIRRSAATSVASLFYLVPAVTAVMAYVLFSERLDTGRDVGHGGVRRPRCFWSTGELNSDQVSTPQKKPPALIRRLRLIGKSYQRFDFLAFFFFLVAFLPAFLTAFLVDFFADFFAEDFFADFLEAFLVFFAFLAFFVVTFFAAFLAVFLTFLTTALAASCVASAALLACLSSFQSKFLVVHIVPQGCRSYNDSGVVGVSKRRSRAQLSCTAAEALSARVATSFVIERQRIFHIGDRSIRTTELRLDCFVASGPILTFASRLADTLRMLESKDH